MKTEKIYLVNKTLFYYIVSENGKQHGLWIRNTIY